MAATFGYDTGMRFLCVSDIHGHADALRAVMREADAHGWDQLVACGDHLFPGPAPLETWKLLVEHRALCVQGIGDRALARLNPDKLSATNAAERQRLERLRQIHVELGALIVARLNKMPTIARLPLENGTEMVVVHGSPADATESFTPDMTDEEIGALIGDDPADIVICGGSHIPFQRQIDHIRVVGVGSVGEAPGGGYAHGVIVESTPLGTAIKEVVAEL